MNHSPEPWRMTRPDGGFLPDIQDASGMPVVYCEGVLSIADARRITECVNALANIPNPAAFLKHIQLALNLLPFAESEYGYNLYVTKILEHLHNAKDCSAP